MIPAIAAFCAPLMLALAIAAWGHGQRPAVEAAAEAFRFFPLASSTQLEQVQIRDARELKHLFAELGYVWPPAPGPSVPRIAIDPLPDDFAWPDDIRHKKTMFFKILTPLVLAENARVLRQRDGLAAALAALHRGEAAEGHPARSRIEALAREYEIDGAPDDPGVQAALLERIDAVPIELVLAQAANESGWGESRFAREGNNLFGVWTYQPENGIVPAARPEGETYAVRRYESLRASVRSHIFNLNIGHAYEDLRDMRAAMRARGEELDALELATGLGRYSIRGEDYIDEIRAIIRVNDLGQAARAELRRLPGAPLSTAAAAADDRSVSLQLASTTAD